jgi:hypothetical protein
MGVPVVPLLTDSFIFLNFRRAISDFEQPGES